MTEYDTGDVGDYINNVHSLAQDNPMMDTIQLEALAGSISSIGQQEPIKIYRGKVVDGRNRLKALDMLGINSVKFKSLPHKTSVDELKKIVSGTETRRHQSKTQLAIKAYRLSINSGVSQAKAAALIGVSTKLVENASSVFNISPDIINGLFEGKRYKFDSGRSTDSLGSILSDLKSKQKEKMINVGSVDIENNDDIDKAKSYATANKVMGVVELMMSDGDWFALKELIIKRAADDKLPPIVQD